MIKRTALSVLLIFGMININYLLYADTVTLTTVGDFQQAEIQNGVILNLSDGEVSQNYRLEPAVLTITSSALPKELYRHAGCIFADTVVVAGGMDMTTYSSAVYLNQIIGNDLTSWRQGPDLPVAIRDHRSCRVGNYFYCFGGRTATAVISTIYRSPINFQDKSLGVWQAVGNLPTPLERFALVKSQGKVYILGGANGSPVNKVYFTDVDPDGNLLTWRETTALPYVAANLGAVVYGDELWIIGGNNGFVDVANIYTAKINLDGSLGAWTAKTSYPLPISRHTIDVTSVGFIVVGGVSNGTNLQAIYCSEINEDNLVISWKNHNLSDNLFDHIGIISGSNCYLIGGKNNSSPLAQCLRLPLNTWQPWKVSTAMTDIIKWPTTITGIHNFAYYTGGLSGATNQWTDRIYRASFQSLGGFGSWTSSGNLPAQLIYHGGVGYNSRMYILGGNIWDPVNGNIFEAGNTNAVYYSNQIDSVAGNVTSWTYGTPLPVTVTSEWVNNSLAYNDFLYVFTKDKIYQNSINGDGSLSSMWAQNTVLPLETANINPTVLNGKLYIFGKTNPVRVFFATIDPSGNLGTWQETLSLSPTFGTQGSSCVFKNTIVVEVQAGYEAQAEINVDGSISRWNRLDDSIQAGVIGPRSIVVNYNNVLNIFDSQMYPLYMNPLKYISRIDVPIILNTVKVVQNMSWQSTFPTSQIKFMYRIYNQQWEPWVEVPDFATDILINENTQYLQLGMNIETTKQNSGLLNEVNLNYSDIPLPTPTLTDFDSSIINEKYTYVYPNPVRGKQARFRVYTKEPAKLLLKIYTPQNKFVYSREITTNGIGYFEFDWECSNLANGVYFYLIEATGLSSGIKEKVLKKMAIIK